MGNPLLKTADNISSFEKNPESGGNPAIASVPIRKVQ